MSNDRTDFQKVLDATATRAVVAMGGMASKGIAVGQVTDGNTSVLVITAADDLVDVLPACRGRMKGNVARKKLPNIAKMAADALAGAQGGAVSASGVEEVAAETLAALREREAK